MNGQSIWYLENIDVTGIFCPNKMDQAQSTISHFHQEYKKGDYIYLQNEAADKIYLIMEGRVKIGSYSENNKEITKTILGDGEIFGELAMLDDGFRRDYAIALEDTSLCIIPSNNMKSLMKEHSGLGMYLMKIMGARVLDMERRLESLVFKDSRTRIIEFLHRLTEQQGRRIGYEFEVRKFITHQEIANLTATSRQTVTTVLNELRAKNIITFNRKRLLVRDMELLLAEATALKA